MEGNKMGRHAFINTGKMTRFILRRDRVRLPIWILSIVFITILTATSFTDLYQNEEERQAIAETMRNPAMTAMVGPGYGLDHYTEGAMMSHQMLLFTAIVAAIMSILLVTRHTRADEEDGRIELIRSLPVGQLTNLSSVMTMMVAANILLALLTGFGLAALQIESMDLSASLLYGSAIGSAGIFFAAITTLFAQLSENSRGTIGYSFTILGLSYLIRAVGDVSNETLSLFSPLGWILSTEVYVNNYWWPIILTLGASVIVYVLAMYLMTKRDLESGLLPSKPGKTYASKLLLSPFGLAVKLQRTAIIAWAIGMFILGVSYGSIFGDLESFFTSNEMLVEMLSPVEGVSLTEQFSTMLMAVMSMISTVPVLLFVLKLKGEEKKGRSEHLLTRVVSRNQLLGSYVILAILFSFIMLFLAMLGLWSTANTVIEEAIPFSSMFFAAMVYLPAIWVMIALAVLALGWIPKATGLSWLYLGYSFLVVYLGGLLQFPEWMAKISPFGYIPEYPVEEINGWTLVILTLIAAGLIMLGFMGYRKRDIEG